MGKLANQGIKAPRAADTLSVVVIALGWLSLLAIVGIGGNFPLNDDYWFHWTARHWAEHGQLRILPAVGQLLVWHAAWGAALIRLFGPSHAVLRCGTFTWGFVGLLTLYALARQIRWERSRALLLVACVGTSPWYVNLSFSYMTDMPHCVLVLLAVLALIRANRGQIWLLIASGLSLGLAALTRQLALLLLPAFLLVILVDARQERPVAWRGLALRRGLTMTSTLLAAYMPWHFWFAAVNGATGAYGDRWDSIRRVSYHPIFHFLASWHYAGLWVFPIAVALWFKSKSTLNHLLPRRYIGFALLGLVGFSIVAPVAWWVDSPGGIGLNVHYPPMMPYLTNLVYLVGVGAPTIYDTYHGKAPLLHAARWAGVPLTLVSILGGLLVFGVVAASVRHAVRFVRGSRCPEPGSSSALENNAGFRDRDRTRLLLLGVSICYFSGLCLVRFIFDRYLLPFLPIALFFAIDVCPPSVVRSKAALAVVTLVALFSLGAMREYMSWNAARYQVVNRLLATGVANDDVDGGYEINGLLRAIPKAVRGDKDLGNPRDPWWGKKSRYRVSFWIDNPTDCTPVDRQPFWSWPGTGPRAVYMLDCDDTIDWDPLSAL